MSAQKKALWTNGIHSISRVGYDTNGNWSYWLKSPYRKRATKIQHALIEQHGCMKLTVEMLNDGKPAGVIANSTTRIVEAYCEMTGIPHN